MRLVALLLAVALVAGCSHAAVAVGSSAAPSGAVAAPGTASISTGSTAAALGLVLIFGTIDYMNNPQSMPSPSSLFMTMPPAPELAPGRRISEQDCSKPVDLSLGNLRCK